MATWLNDDGYQTALIGKYFNAYDESRATYVPPGWDRWVAFAVSDLGGGGYTNYGLSIDGTLKALRNHGRRLFDRRARRLRGRVHPERGRSGRCRCSWTSQPTAPHEPAEGGARAREHLLLTLAPYRPPNFNEADVSDKPAYIRAIPLLFVIADASAKISPSASSTGPSSAVDDAVEDDRGRALPATGPHVQHAVPVHVRQRLLYGGAPLGDHRSDEQAGPVRGEHPAAVHRALRLRWTSSPRTDPNSGG